MDISTLTPAVLARGTRKVRCAGVEAAKAFDAMTVYVVALATAMLGGAFAATFLPSVASAVDVSAARLALLAVVSGGLVGLVTAACWRWLDSWESAPTKVGALDIAVPAVMVWFAQAASLMVVGRSAGYQDKAIVLVVVAIGATLSAGLYVAAAKSWRHRPVGAR